MGNLVVALTSLALVSAIQEGSDIACWIRDLDHEEIARREAAQSSLLKAGEKALPAMKKALATSSGEPALRLLDLIAEIERPARERTHDEAERRRILELITFEDRDYRLSEVLQAIETAAGYKPQVEVKDDPIVRVGGKDQILRRVLDSIEDQLGVTLVNETLTTKNPATGGKTSIKLLHVKLGRPQRRPLIHIPGESLEFMRKPHRVNGVLAGWVVECGRLKSFDLMGTTVEVKRSDGSSAETETCGRCSPVRTLVKAKEGEKLRLQVRGTKRWESRYHFDIADPSKAHTFRVGAYTIRYDFPKVRVTTADPTDPKEFATVYMGGVFLPGQGLRFVPRVGGVFDTMDPAKSWCYCKEGPTPAVAAKVNRILEKEFSKYEHNSVSDFQSMKILFLKAFLEPFEGEVTIPPPEY